MNLVVSWLVAGVVVALVATIASRAIPSGSPGARHAFWWLVLTVILAIPFLPAAGALVNFGGPFGPRDVEGAQLATAAAAIGALTIPAPPSWLPAAGVFVWAVAALFAAVRLAINMTAVRRLLRNARPLPGTRAGRFEQFAQAGAGSRQARVFVSNDLRGACALGFFEPRILVSSDLVATLDHEAIEAIVLHEYAHLQRYDDWTRLVQRLVIAVAGIHPAVRWVSRHIDVEREAACDRMVVARTGAPVTYGKALTAAAEISSRMSGLTPFAAPGAPISGAGLHARIRRLLEADRVRPPVVWATTAAGAAALVASTAAVASLPPLVVVASLERPLLELQSVPLKTVLVELSPVASGTLWATVQADTSSSLEAEDAMGQQPANVVPVVPQNRADATEPVVGHEELAVASAEPVASDGKMPIASIPLSHTITAPRLANSQKGKSADQGGLGQDAAQIGMKTGEVAARTGTSIGRFFKNGGLAIANSF